mmetsp:Transcript_30976/g.52145  ORF Transcript_30976/g.52145 Transcript_30976/m.52145 type:complete len:117 (+) Transcript_30976:446-796(+)
MALGSNSSPRSSSRNSTSSKNPNDAPSPFHNILCSIISSSVFLLRHHNLHHRLSPSSCFHFPVLSSFSLNEAEKKKKKLFVVEKEKKKPTTQCVLSSSSPLSSPLPLVPLVLPLTP